MSIPSQHNARFTPYYTTTVSFFTFALNVFIILRECLERRVALNLIPQKKAFVDQLIGKIQINVWIQPFHSYDPNIKHLFFS